MTIPILYYKKAFKVTYMNSPKLHNNDIESIEKSSGSNTNTNG